MRPQTVGQIRTEDEHQKRAKRALNSHLERIQQLVDFGNVVLSVDQDAESEIFEEKVSVYLKEFEDWQKQFEVENVLEQDSFLEKDELRSNIQQLNTIHQQIIARVDLRKQDVVTGLSDLHKRGQALRAYVDRYPSRITVAGKRKG